MPIPYSRGCVRFQSALRCNLQEEHDALYRLNFLNLPVSLVCELIGLYTVFQKSDAKIQITITTAYLIRIKYPLCGFNYHLSDVNFANFNKIHHSCF